MARKKSAAGKKNFSSFTLATAMMKVGLTELTRWDLDAPLLPPSDFFRERLHRLEVFDLKSSEHSKKLLIDACFEEALQSYPALRVWKGAPLQSDELTGLADYLIAPRRAYLAGPFVCVVEAKKDDFEKGLAQCLVEMEACRWNNRQAGLAYDIYGIVTNGEGWHFYRLTQNTEVFETSLYTVKNIAEVLGALSYIASQSVANLEG